MFSTQQSLIVACIAAVAVATKVNQCKCTQRTPNIGRAGILSIIEELDNDTSFDSIAGRSCTKRGTSLTSQSYGSQNQFKVRPSRPGFDLSLLTAMPEKIELRGAQQPLIPGRSVEDASDSTKDWFSATTGGYWDRIQVPGVQQQVRDLQQTTEQRYIPAAAPGLQTTVPRGRGNQSQQIRFPVQRLGNQQVASGRSTQQTGIASNLQKNLSPGTVYTNVGDRSTQNIIRPSLPVEQKITYAVGGVTQKETQSCGRGGVVQKDITRQGPGFQAETHVTKGPGFVKETSFSTSDQEFDLMKVTPPVGSHTQEHFELVPLVAQAPQIQPEFVRTTQPGQSTTYTTAPGGVTQQETQTCGEGGVVQQDTITQGPRFQTETHETRGPGFVKQTSFSTSDQEFDLMKVTPPVGSHTQENYEFVPLTPQPPTISNIFADEPVDRDFGFGAIDPESGFDVDTLPEVVPSSTFGCDCLNNVNSLTGAGQDFPNSGVTVNFPDYSQQEGPASSQEAKGYGIVDRNTQLDNRGVIAPVAPAAEPLQDDWTAPGPITYFNEPVTGEFVDAFKTTQPAAIQTRTDTFEQANDGFGTLRSSIEQRNKSGFATAEPTEPEKTLDFFMREITVPGRATATTVSDCTDQAQYRVLAPGSSYNTRDTGFGGNDFVYSIPYPGRN